MSSPSPPRFTTTVLHHAADSFRLLVESVKDYAIYLLDPGGKIVSWNTGAERIKGYTADEILGQPFELMFTPEDRAAGKPSHALRLALADGKFEEECLRCRKDGTTFWGIYTVTALYEQGRHVGFSVIVRDISERKRAEEALRRERDFADTILNSLPGVFYLYDESGRFLRWNKRFETVTGYTAEEMATAHPLNFFTGAERDLIADRIASVFRTGSDEVEAHFVTKSGQQIPYYFNGLRAELHGRRCLLGMGIDISERKRAEQELWESEVRHRRLLEVLPDAVFVSTDDRISYCNPAMVRLMRGHSEADILGQSPLKFVHPDHHSGVRERIDQMLARNGTVDKHEDRFVRLDGSIVPVEVVATMIYYRGQKSVLVVLHDLSIRRAAEERLRLFMDHTPAQAWITDEDGICRFANLALTRALGYSREQMIGQPVTTLLAGRDDLPVARYLDGDRHVLATGTPYQAILPAPRGDGTLGQFLVYKFPLGQMPDGRRLIGGVSIDVTDREKALADLRHSEERLRLMIDNIKDHALFTLDPEGIITTWNPGAQRMYGYEADEVIGRHRELFFTPEDRAAGKPRQEIAEAAKAGQIHEEGWRVHKNGHRFWIEGTISALYHPDGRVRGFVKVVRDMTQQKQAETELRIRESRFRSLVVATSQMVWTADPLGQHLHATPSWSEYTGLPPETAQGWGWTAAIHPEDRDRATTQWQTAMAKAEQFEIEFRVRRADGAWRHLVARGVPLLQESGELREWVGVCEDDTEHLQAVAEMRMRDRAIQAVPQGILITDPNQPDNPVVFASDGFERTTGYSPAEILGKNCRFLQGEDTDPDTVRVIREAIQQQKGCHVEILNYKRDGTPFWNALDITPVRDHAGKLTHFIGVLADITEKRELLHAFYQSQKLEAIGRLAGGVAHDFNNMLTVISGFSDLLLMDDDLSPEQRDMVTEIKAAGERAAGLTRQLLAFSRKQIVEPVVIDVNIEVSQCEKMIRRLLGEDIDLTLILDPETPPVKIDPGQLDQVLLNLCVNSRDAMPRGGKLTLQTQLMVVDTPPASDPDLSPGRYALLSVTDTGCGMTDEVKARVFEPFFTTKPSGSGTGLGLPTVYGIIKQAGGRIRIESEVNVGTTVKVYLPAVETPATLANTSRPARPLHGTETILFVDDEPGILMTARLALEAEGYTVLVANDGADALRIVESHTGPIHLVITDVVMPGMGGRPLADALRARFPGIRVLFVSGYTDDAVIRHGVIEKTEYFLQKPFAPLGLVKKVRDVLDGTA